MMGKRIEARVQLMADTLGIEADSAQANHSEKLQVARHENPRLRSTHSTKNLERDKISRK